MKYVYVENGVVTEVTQTDPYLLFLPGYASLFIKAPDEVFRGWEYDGNSFINPVKNTEPTLKEIHEQKLRQKQEREEQFQLENKKRAIFLLFETDWSELPSVIDTSKKRYLINQKDFIEYRDNIREIMIDPPKEIIDNCPTVPKAQWS